MKYLLTHDARRVPWNKGLVTGQEPPLKRSKIRLKESDRVPAPTVVPAWVDSRGAGDTGLCGPADRTGAGKAAMEGFKA